MTEAEYIKVLEEKLRLETKRADENYLVAEFFENLYDELVDWLVDQEEKD